MWKVVKGGNRPGPDLVYTTKVRKQAFHQVSAEQSQKELVSFASSQSNMILAGPN